MEEGALSNEEMRAIVESWTLVEDDPLVVDSEVDEAIALPPETEAEDHILDFCDDDKPRAQLSRKDQR